MNACRKIVALHALGWMGGWGRLVGNGRLVVVTNRVSECEAALHRPPPSDTMPGAGGSVWVPPPPLGGAGRDPPPPLIQPPTSAHTRRCDVPHARCP